ncbi:MAG: hypothetical protein A4E42_00459 [Methanoregulaceae archaeon PtaU1.Bin222]|nr:MAG: hypothetical protein A4E42_00459 [Methanoregulaceae archaeon PtaU1.Bin222]
MHETDSIVPELEDMPDCKPRNRDWSDRDIAILKRYWGKKDPEAIAEVLDRTIHALEQKVRGLKRNREWDVE